jgi:molybdenum cofactor cytidylyltransferase
VGGGGKTSLMFALAAALPGQTVMTTTTRIFAAQMKLAAAVCFADDLSSLGQQLHEHGRVLLGGEVQGEKAVGVSPEIPAQLLARTEVDFVLVEADGSRMRPIKAPAAHEPVIAVETNLVIPVVGIDALAGSIAEVAHRPELVRTVIGDRYSVSREQLSVRDVAVLLSHAQGGLKNVPPGARVIPFINKVENDAQLADARQIAQHILQITNPQPPITDHRLPITRVVIGAVKSAEPILEVQTPVTAVILAAGQGKRMGQTKQLLPWGQTTVLGQTKQNTRRSLATDVCVVSGHEAEKVEAIAIAENVYAIRNMYYADAEMLSSLQTAVAQLPEKVTAVLVILADQPLIAADIMDQLLNAFWQGKGD